MTSHRGRFAFALGLALLAFWSAFGAAAAPDAGAAHLRDSGTDHEEAGVPSAVATTASHISALVAGTLDVRVAVQSLFDVPLDDPTALAVETRRLRAVLRDEDAGTSSDAGTAMTQAQQDRWDARRRLDRARLSFYELPSDARESLLAAQRTRVGAVRPQESEAQRKEREANEEREQALEAARQSRSEGERVVSEELARLITVEQSATALDSKLAEGRDELAARKDALLVWQRRVRDAKSASPEEADDVYDALRKTLSSARDAQSHALDRMDDSTRLTPVIGANPLNDIPPEIPTDEVRARRATVERQLQKTAAEEQSLREDRAAALQAETDSLNRERLGLLPFLSDDKRGAITGFTDAGLDQAQSEARQLALILRYHRYQAKRWVQSLVEHDGDAGVPTWRILAVIVPWILGLSLFLWGRRRVPEVLNALETRIALDDRKERRVQPTPRVRSVRFVRGVHRAVEWLLFFVLSLWLLPEAARRLLEVELLTLIIGWTLGGAIIVDIINALSAVLGSPELRSGGHSAELRLRSLRLVGRVVVGFALTLAISARLVGQGTVYQWVLSTCWFAAIPVFLVLVRWWRSTVFERLDRVRRKSRLQAWVLANRVGWKSFFAAMLAAVQMFAVGTYKTVRNWLSGFNLARRADAYLFKRDLERLAKDATAAHVSPPAAVLDSLSPTRDGGAWIDCPADDHLATIQARVASNKGGVIALIGGRGMGKTTFLKRLEREITGAKAIRCDVDDPRAAFAFAEAAPLVLVDEANSLIKPIVGGLKDFDEAITFARERGSGSLWVFAIDAIIWPFLRRARDSRPVFDEVLIMEAWSDEQIGALLVNRSAGAGITPTFEELLEKLPPAADEIDKQQALVAKSEGYYRMIWDYVDGNPAMALEAWRSSLSAGAEEAIRVRPLRAPSPTVLEALPDSAFFVLRAILQLAPASVADVSTATRLTEPEVQNAIRIGQVQGYVEERDGRVTISWFWLRAVMRMLERRHLLVNS